MTAEPGRRSAARILARLEEDLLAAALAVMTLVTFANVVDRKFLHVGLAFAEELTVSLFVWASLLGAAVATRRGLHLGFSFLADRLPPRGRLVTELLSGAAALLVFGLLGWYGIGWVATQYRYDATTPAMGWPAWLFGLAIPVGSAVIVLRTVEGMVRAVRDSRCSR
ncbi:MAG TPA: TRAP transporter small permease [Thermodesulfobacteriota bacterium]